MATESETTEELAPLTHYAAISPLAQAIHKRKDMALLDLILQSGAGEYDIFAVTKHTVAGDHGFVCDQNDTPPAYVGRISINLEIANALNELTSNLVNLIKEADNIKFN